MRNPAGRRKLAAESVSDGESLKNERPEGLLPGHSALFIPCRPRNPKRDRPRDIGDRGSPARLHEQMCQKQSKQLPAREISRRVDFPLQHFVECAGIACTEILLWRNKCLTVAAFAANGGILCFLAEEDCPLIAHVNVTTWVGSPSLAFGRCVGERLSSLCVRVATTASSRFISSRLITSAIFCGSRM